MSFLLDTDTCSAHLKVPGLLTGRFLQYMGRLHVSTITMSEPQDATSRSLVAPCLYLRGIRHIPLEPGCAPKHAISSRQGRAIVISSNSQEMPYHDHSVTRT